MERARESIFRQIGGFFKSFVGGVGSVEVDESKLSREDKALLKKLREQDAVGRMEGSLRGKYRATVDTGGATAMAKAKAKDGNEKRLEERT